MRLHSVSTVRAAVRFFRGVPHPHLLGVLSPGSCVFVLRRFVEKGIDPSPPSRTRPASFRGGVAQLVRALPCHGRGYGFEPRHSRHSPQSLTRKASTFCVRFVKGCAWKRNRVRISQVLLKGVRLPIADPAQSSSGGGPSPSAFTLRPTESKAAPIPSIASFTAKWMERRYVATSGALKTQTRSRYRGHPACHRTSGRLASRQR